MPPNYRQEDPRYGRLSFAIHQVVTQTPVPLTYRELGQQVALTYQRWGWEPPGGLAGGGLNREVLGKREWKSHSNLLMTHSDDGGLQVNQGLAHGLTENTILKVLQSSRMAGADYPIGYVRVARVGPTWASVEPVEYGDAKRVGYKEFPDHCRCEIEEFDYGQLRISVRVRAFTAGELAELEKSGAKLSEADAAAVDQAARVIGDAAGRPTSLVRVAERGESADVYLLVAREGVYLRRRGESITTKGSNPQQFFGPYRIDDELTERLDGDLKLLARGVNLLGLASADGFKTPDDRPVSVKVTMSRAASKEGPYTEITDPAAASFTDGEHLRLTLVNDGEVPVDLTVLYLDAAFQIQSHFPSVKQAYLGIINRIEPGQSHQVTIGINDSTVGLEHVLVLAVASDPTVPPASYAFLSQPGIKVVDFPVARGGKAGVLDQLLKAGFNEGSQARSTAEAARSYSISSYPLTVVKKPANPQPASPPPAALQP
jgi:hypothetical protein